MSALNINDPSRSTNAAFAIGRLIEGDDGKKTLISDCGQYQIVSFIIQSIQFSSLRNQIVRCLGTNA
jgi:hypothetical protein